VPIYEYKCEKGHTFEVQQRMADDAITECSVCGKPVQRVFHPIAVHFKGSGFYNTDYGKKGAKAGKEKSEAENNSSGSSSDSSDSDSGSKPKDSKDSKDSKDTKKKETKAPAASSASDSKS